MKKLVLPVVAMTMLGAAAFSPAFAAHSGEHTEAQALLAAAKITLSEAVAKAEALHSGARALEIELDDKVDNKPDGGAVWKVTLITPDKIYDVVLDAASGEVISNMEDKK